MVHLAFRPSKRKGIPHDIAEILKVAPLTIIKLYKEFKEVIREG